MSNKMPTAGTVHHRGELGRSKAMGNSSHLTSQCLEAGQTLLVASGVAGLLPIPMVIERVYEDTKIRMDARPIVEEG
jgi:hypothetical protein